MVEVGEKAMNLKDIEEKLYQDGLDDDLPICGFITQVSGEEIAWLIQRVKELEAENKRLREGIGTFIDWVVGPQGIQCIIDIPDSVWKPFEKLIE